MSFRTGTHVTHVARVGLALTDFRRVAFPIKSPPMQAVRVDPAGLAAMAGRWATAAGELHVPAAPTASGLPSQASVAAVNVAHADVTAFTARLADRVQAHSRRVAEAGRRYASNEADSANAMAAVARSAAHSTVPV